jgi:hypothetical protein
MKDRNEVIIDVRDDTNVPLAPVERLNASDRVARHERFALCVGHFIRH